jgi:hypothetical protein
LLWAVIDGCVFGTNYDTGVVLNSYNNVSGTAFLVTSGTCGEAILVKSLLNTISGCRFAAQSGGWTDGVVVIDAGSSYASGLAVTGCSFHNREAFPMFGFGTNSTKLRYATITGNTFYVSGAIAEAVGGSVNNEWKYVNFCNNVVIPRTNLGTLSLFDLRASAGSNRFMGNQFVNPESYTCASVYRGSLINSVWHANEVLNISPVFYSGATLTGTTITANPDYVTRSSGAGVVASGTTYIDVTHGLASTPSANDIMVTPTNSLGNSTKYYISDIGATTFRINVDADPGATTATFSWIAEVNP